MAWSMVFTVNLEFQFWGDALHYACYFLNRTPSRTNPGRMSPIEMLTGKKQDLSRAVIFGSSCTVRVKSGKTWPKRAKPGKIIGISEETKGYKVFIPEDRVVVASQHVQNISTLSDQQNEVLLRQIKEELRVQPKESEDKQAQVQEKPVALPPITPEGMVTRGKSKKVVFHETDDIHDEDVSRFMNMGIMANVYGRREDFIGNGYNLECRCNSG
jgi:hypothetical protein